MNVYMYILFNFWRQNSVYKAPRFSIESQGITEGQDKEKTKTPRITDKGWNSQKRLSDPVEKKMKEEKRRKKRLLYLHPKLSSGLVPL